MAAVRLAPLGMELPQALVLRWLCSVPALSVRMRRIHDRSPSLSPAHGDVAIGLLVQSGQTQCPHAAAAADGTGRGRRWQCSAAELWLKEFGSSSPQTVSDGSYSWDRNSALRSGQTLLPGQLQHGLNHAARAARAASPPRLTGAGALPFPLPRSHRKEEKGELRRSQSSWQHCLSSSLSSRAEPRQAGTWSAGAPSPGG